MKMYLKTAVAALALCGTALVASGAADAQRVYHRTYHHNQTVLSVLFGNVAFGYQDGYWDNSHRWHRWSNDGEYRNYRDHGANYRGWNHDRDGEHGGRNGDQGWRGR